MAEEEKNSLDTIRNVKQELKNKTAKYINGKKHKKHVIVFETKELPDKNNEKNNNNDQPLRNKNIKTISKKEKEEKTKTGENMKSTLQNEQSKNKNNSKKKTKSAIKNRKENRKDILNYSNAVRKNNLKSVPKYYNKNYKVNILFEYINLKDLIKNRNLDTFVIVESEKAENTKKVDVSPETQKNETSEKNSNNKQSSEKKTGKRFSFILFSADTYENKRKSSISNTDALKSKRTETNRSKTSLINVDNSENTNKNNNNNIPNSDQKEIFNNKEINEIKNNDNQSNIKKEPNNNLNNIEKNSNFQENDGNSIKKDKNNNNINNYNNKQMLQNKLLNPLDNKSSQLPSLTKKTFTTSNHKRNSAIIGKTKIKNLGFDIKDITKTEEDENELLKSEYNALKSQVKEKEILKIDSNNSIGYKSDGSKTENNSSLFILINQQFIPFTDKKEKKEDNENNKEQIYHIFGICRGGGDFGQIISNYLSSNIPKNINRELNNLDNKITTIEKNSKNFEYIIKNIFYQINNYLNNNQDVDTSTSGSTFCSLIITQKNIISINLGNNKAIIGIKKKNNEKNTDKKTSNFIYRNLTSCHIPSIKEEKQRILENNGTVNYSIGYNNYDYSALRIKHPNLNVPGLKITRCFGFKDWNNIGVICDPEIHFIKLEERFKFIIIGSDSLWEAITNQEAVDIVEKYYDNKDIKGAVKDLVKTAKINWIKKKDLMDDMSVIVIFFNDGNKENK